MLRIFMIIASFAIIGISFPEEKVRIIHYEGKDYRTTFLPGNKFIGKYSGKKTGYLLLNEDGTGEYRYDVFGVAPASCKPNTIAFDWGFLLNEKGEIVKMERDYGYSFPILMKCTGNTFFQGCSKQVFIDYILEYKNGDLHVSSSDDWVKKPTVEP